MGLTKKSDGRYVVGKGIEDGNEYKGSAAWRDMVIQYSGDGATDKSLEYLTFLKDYALYHSAQGNPVIPPNVQIWMSTANTMKAVEADDITVDGVTVKIGACTWDGSAWSFDEPTPGGGGSSLPAYTSADKGKFLGLADDAEHTETVVIIPEQTVTIVDPNVSREVALPDVDPSLIVNGETVTYTVNNVATTGTVADYGIDGAESTYIYVNDGVVTFGGEDAGDYVISLTKSVPSVEPKWEEASGLPSYTGSDIGKVLTIVVDAEHQTQQVVIPEQTITLSQSGAMWGYIFTDDDGVNSAFFINASVGDKCTITIDEGPAVESTATSVYGMTLFPVGDYYVGNGTMFGGIGVASPEANPKSTIKILATATAPGATAGYEKTPFTVTVDWSYGEAEGTSDKTYADILSAYNAYKPIFLRTYGGNAAVCFFSSMRKMTNNGTPVFQGTQFYTAYNTTLQKNVLGIVDIYINEDDTVSIDDVGYTALEPTT